jgi:mycothiol synthase
MEIRAIKVPDEVGYFTALHNAVNPDDPVTVEDSRGWAESVRESGYFVVGAGEPVAGAWIVLQSRPVPEARILVLEAHRGRGIGSALFVEVSRWAAERGHGELETRVRELHPDGLAFAEHRGFIEIGRERALELDLTSIEAPAVNPPEGIEIVTWAERPDATQGLYAVYCEAVPDVPGEEDSEIESLEVWLANHMGGPGDKPEATFVALAGDEVVGYSKFALTNAQPTTAHHDLTGVQRAWRGRGVASALKAAQISWAKESGYERLVTQNEERNAPIRRLNERFGYRPAPGRVLMRGPIARSESSS